MGSLNNMGRARTSTIKKLKVFTFLATVHIASPAIAQLTLNSRQNIDLSSIWNTLPQIEGTLLNGEPDIFKHKTGQVSVVFFLASWCIPCQQLSQPLKSIENDYNKLNVNIIWVFNHDLVDDVKAFARSHKLDDKNIILGSKKTLLRYRDPTLPAMFIADKHGWLVTRFLGTKDKSIEPSELRDAIDHLIIK